MLSSNTYDDVEYYVDGHNFKEYGVYVSASDGLIGQLERKEALTVDYSNYHGISRDRSTVRYKSRSISLQCFIEAKSRSEFIERINNFLCLFTGNKPHRLKVEYNGDNKPLLYEVDFLAEMPIDKRWGVKQDDMMIGVFTLKLTEDEPVKRILRCTGISVSITVTTQQLLNIYWGDGTHTYNVKGNNKTVTHTYSRSGKYDIVITGVIENIERFTTNATVIWDLLK